MEIWKLQNYKITSVEQQTAHWYDIPNIFEKISLWNSREYSEIMFWKYWIQEYSLIVPWTF